MLSFHELSTDIPAGDYRLWVYEDGSVMYREEFGDKASPGEIMVLGDGEYVQAEVHGDRLVVSWSSSTDSDPLAFFLAASAQLNSPVSPTLEGYLQLAVATANGDVAEGTGPEILGYLEAETPDVAFVRINLTDDTRLSWGAAATRLVASKAPFVEVSIDAPRTIERDRLQNLIMEFASPELHHHKSGVLDELRLLVA